MEKKICDPCEKPIVEPAKCPRQCGSERCKGSNKQLDIKNKPIVWVLGGPGSGKGTQCEKIIAKYGFTHLSSGDLLRTEVKSGSERGKALSDIMAKGELVPNETVLELLREAIVANLETSRGFLIDGYPREQLQGVAFEKTIAPVTIVVYFEANDDTMRQRLLGRGRTSGRADDKEEAINQRLRVFHENNQMVLQQYAQKLVRINAENSADTIFTEVVAALDPVMEELADREILAN